MGKMGQNVRGSIVGKDLVYRPDYVVPPGDTIRECLSVLAWDVEAAASRIGCPSDELMKIITEGAPISRKLAAGLESAIGTPASFWLNLGLRFQAHRRASQYT